jgi:glyoxylase-like metal-dependent hydrolase (beta-lactamase superfamily II)
MQLYEGIMVTSTATGTAVPLEDSFNDIIGKAMRGLRISDSEVAERTGIAALEVQRLREGQFNEVAARKIARVLGLHAGALVDSGRKAWRPQPVALDGLVQFHTPFEDMTVNSYLVWDPASGQAAAFDTGADCSEMLDFLSDHKLKLSRILLTHTHGDHIFDLDRLKAATGAPAYVSALEPLEGAHALSSEERFELGGLRIDLLQTSGHSVGGITYWVRGLQRPVAIVGDAIFAGSMGGGMVSYEDALRNNREKILALPEETVLCPGHGPLTTVGEERQHNPFFA